MRLVHRAGLVLGLAAVTACSDSVSPKSLANPQQTTEQMAAFDTLFNAAILNSFNTLSFHITPAPVAARDLAAAANPLAKSSALRPYSKGLETSLTLSRLVTTINASAQDLFPPDVDGKTYEWNITTDIYEATARAGAPNDGVRFILYAIDPFTSLPAEPLVEVGYVELDDVSTASVDKVHVKVVGSGVTYIDYEVSVASTSATSARLETAGYITNGATSPDTLDFSGTITISAGASSFAVTQDVSFDVDSHDAHVRLWERVTLNQNFDGNVRIFFSFTHGTETVTLDATFEITGGGQNLSGTVALKVDGGPFATCTVEAAPASYILTCEGADADGLNAAEAQAIDAIGEALAGIETVFSSILTPATDALGAAQ